MIGESVFGTAGRKASRTLPRVVGAGRVDLQYSSPAPGRPVVFWHEGNSRGIVRETWTTLSDSPTSQVGRRKILALGTTKKEVVYLRSAPEVRLVLLLGDPYEHEGHQWQKILRSSVERDGGIDVRATRQLEQRLWDEGCQVEYRGRPPGTGRPKKMWWEDIDPNRVHLQPLKRAGLDDRDVRIFFGKLERKTGKQIGREMGTSQAVHNRMNRRIKPKISRMDMDKVKKVMDSIQENIRQNTA